MKTILLGGLDPDYLGQVRFVFETLEEGYSLTPLSTAEACRDRLQRGEGDLLVLDLDADRGAAWAWLAVVSELRATLPIVALGTQNQPDVAAFEKAHPGQYFPFLTYLRKPVPADTLLDAIRNEIQQATWGVIQGLSLPSLLQMLNMEQKTCTIRVTSGRRQGFFYVKQGQVINARYRRLEGMEALRLMVLAPSPKVEIASALHDATQTIQLRLEEILMQAAQFLDETPKDCQYPTPEDGYESSDALPASEVGKWERPAKPRPEPARPEAPKRRGWLLVAGAVVAMALGGGGWLLMPRTVELSLESTPPGAKVTLNGVDQGPTPLRLKLRQPPQGTLSLSHSGFEPFQHILRPDDRSLAFALRPIQAPVPTPSATPPPPEQEVGKSKVKAAAPRKGQTAQPQTTIFDQLRKQKD